MYCCKCQNDLSKCACPDLQERLASLAKCEHLFIAPRQMEKYQKQAEVNKEQQTGWSEF